jgi:thiol-disulfide isomerase/thioredoxin
MAGFLEWLEERRTEGLGAVLSLLLIAAGLGGLVWIGWRAWTGGGGSSSFVGRNVSAVSLVDADGNSVRVGDLDGKVVVLDFWATWCPPCRMSLPEVAALQAKQGDDYAVLPVSLDQGGFRDVAPFLKQNPQLGLAAVVPADLRALMGQVGTIEAIPTTLVVGRDGKVVRAWSGYSPGHLERELRAALKP